MARSAFYEYKNMNYLYPTLQNTFSRISPSIPFHSPVSLFLDPYWPSSTHLRVKLNSTKSKNVIESLARCNAPTEELSYALDQLHAKPFKGLISTQSLGRLFKHGVGGRLEIDHLINMINL